MKPPTVPAERDDQPSLFDDAPAWVQRGPIDRAFWTFHTANPGVYRELVAMTRQAKDAGRTKVGIGQMFEVLRWQRYIAIDDRRQDFRLNNNFRSRYSRLIEEREADLVGMFEKRRLTAP